MKLLLAPLGPGGERYYRTASFDLDNDQPMDQAARRAEPAAILLVDGTFLQRPELRDGFDISIYVAAADDVATARGVNRDAGLLGGIAAATELYTRRYRPAIALYERLCAPSSRADAVFDNNDLERPRLTIRADGRLAAAHDPRKV